MPQFIEHPVLFQDDAVRGEEIREFFGRISTGTDTLSVALLQFPEGWSEPPQKPEFDEFSIVLEGSLYLDTESVGTVVVKAGQGILTPRGERVQYRTPEPGGAKYLSVCVSAFAPELTHRDSPGVELPKTEKAHWHRESRIVPCWQPSLLQGTGMNLKLIEEYFGLFNSSTTSVSMARVVSPEGCIESFQQVPYDKYYAVLKGVLSIEMKSGETFTIRAGQAILVEKDVRTQYGTPYPGGAEYFVVCIPARDLDFDHRQARTEIGNMSFSE